MKADSAASGRLFTQLALVDEMSARLGLALSEGSSVVTQQFRARHAKLHKDYRTVNQQFAEVKALAASKVQASESRTSSNPPNQCREGSSTGRRQERSLVSARNHEEVSFGLVSGALGLGRGGGVEIKKRNPQQLTFIEMRLSRFQGINEAIMREREEEIREIHQVCM
jgi:hypothetical protein